MASIAAMTDCLKNSQKSFYLVKEFNKIAKDPSVSCLVFTSTTAVPITKPLFPCYNISFYADYSGVCIGSSLADLRIMTATSNNVDKYFYLWDFEWLDNPISHNTTCDLLRENEIKIIARSESHSKLIENYCNKKPVGILDDWNSEELRKIVGV